MPEMATLAWLDGGGDKLDAMLTEARWLLEQHEAAKEVERSRLARLEEQWDRVQKERARWESSGLVELCKKRKELEMQLEFLYMHRALEQLRASRSPEEISALVMKVVKHLPAQLPKQSPFSQRLRQVVQEQRQRLLDSFHAKFEAHLEQPSAQQSVHVWSAFLESGKGWLLSFALLTLLPLRLGESTQRALEMLQRDVLEEALVPLWGRFRYHLAAARESSEEGQVLWTFAYSKSHVELLCSLCLQLTSSPALQKLGGGSRPGVYEEAAMAHVAETAVRLLRAHVALLLVSPKVTASASAVSTTARGEAGLGMAAGGVLMRLIEACLDIDQHVFSLLPVGTRDHTLLATHVVCDHRPSLEAWVLCDSDLLCGAGAGGHVGESFSSWGEAFAGAFDNLWAPTSVSDPAPLAAAGDGGGGGGDDGRTATAREGRGWGTGQGKSTFCYRSTYACLSGLSLACCRYKLLPRKGQIALVRAVVLPLLAALLGSLLLRLRSSPALLASPSSSHHSKREDDEEREFFSSASYADGALQALSINGAGDMAAPEAAAFNDLWAAVSSWVPKTVSPEAEALVVEDYAITPAALLRRVIDWAAAGPDAGGDAATGAGADCVGGGGGSLAGVVETARHVISTLRESGRRA